MSCPAHPTRAWGRHRTSLAVAAALSSLIVGAGFGLTAGVGRAAARLGRTAEAPIHLTVSDLTRPLAVSGTPQFGWLPQDAAGDEGQSAYRIVVTDGLTGVPVWDSGKVMSSRESYVPYAGPALADGGEYEWSVTTWNREGDQSRPASSSFDTAIKDNEWSGAQWIRRPTAGNDSTVDYTLARRQFALRASSVPVTRALVYLAAPMRSQLSVNGTVVDTQDDYQTAGENYYGVQDITSLARQAQQIPGSAAGQLAVGVLYAHWAAGEAHPEGPQPYATTLSAPASAGDKTFTVTPGTGSTCTSAPSQSAEFCAPADDWYTGETLGFGTVGTPSFTTDTIAGISQNSVTLTSPLPAAETAGASVISENGPSGLLAKVVVDYANGSSDTFVSDNSWMVTKDTAEVNTSPKMRSTQNAGDFVESYDATAAQSLAGWNQVGYKPTAAWQPPVVMGTAPLPNPPNCGNYSTTNGHDTAPSPPATATRTPVLSSPCGFTHLVPLQAPVTYKIIHPTSVVTLPDGTVEARFPYAFIATPVVRFPGSSSTDTGARVNLAASYRLAGTVTTAAAAAGATTLAVDASSSYPDFTNGGFAVGDPITIDAPADGFGAGDPETDTITSINGGTIGLATPLRRVHPAGIWVEGARVGTDTLDTQSTNLNFDYTEDGRAGETTGFYVPMGWQYLQIGEAKAGNGGRPLTTNDIWAVEQYNGSSQVGSGAPDPGGTTGGPDVPDNVPSYANTSSDWNPASVYTDAPASTIDEAATFASSSSELNSVFTLMERSALFAGQQAYEDSPDRQEGQFTGDGVDESQAAIETLNQRGLTREFIDNLIASQQRWWIAGSPMPASTWGEINAIYPDNLSDNRRDIPDYTEMFPELVWDYYVATGDRATLAAAYPTMQNIARYISDNTSPTGQASGLVCQLASFSTSTSYRYGIIDWPATDRYNTVVLNSGVDTVVNERAVEDYRDLANTAKVLDEGSDVTTYGTDATNLTTAINSKLVDPNGLYDDGMTVAGGSQDVGGDCSATSGDALIGNASQLDQSFAIVYGVAPVSSYQRLGRFIVSQGMKQGPMDLGQLELALAAANQPAALRGLLTDVKGDGPAKILAEGGSSMWEQWNPGCDAPGGHAGDNTSYENTACTGAAISQSSSESFSHGWGSVGAYPMIRGLLGITPAGVGASTVDITPPSAGLASASGTEWTERGPVSLRWLQRSAGPTAGEDSLRVTVPDNVTATVALPAGAGRYSAVGAGHPRYLGSVGHRQLFTTGSGTTYFTPGVARRRPRARLHHRHRGGEPTRR